MKLRDWLILIFTFVVGIMSGMYFYVTAYKPIYDVGVVTDNVSANKDFSIIGVTYGGFTVPNYIHPSFRVHSDGSYDYFEGGTTQSGKREGDLPSQLFRALKDAVATANLDALSADVNGKNCASYADGIEYEYSIERKEVEYVLDTCTTAFENSTTLGQVLLEVWEYLDTPDAYSFSIRNMPETADGNEGEWRGVKGFLEDAFIKSGFDSTF